MRRLGTGLIFFFIIATWAGCGGGTKTVTEKQTDASTRTTTEPKKSDKCDDLIDRDEAGRCKGKDGVTGYVSAPGGTVRLRELSMKYVSVEAKPTITSDGASETAKAGEFLIVHVALTNRTHQPQDVPGHQPQDVPGHEFTQLSFGENTYAESFDAENQTQPDSFMSQSLEKLQPGQTLKGSFVYDVPAKVSQAVKNDRRGQIYMGNFSDLSVTYADQLGVLRLGNVDAAEAKAKAKAKGP